MHDGDVSSQVSGAHGFQKQQCARAKEIGAVPILNAACKEDPAHLGRDFNAVNLDITDFDPHTDVKLTDLRNFVQGNLLEASSIFGAGQFGMVVLGEFLEHCVYDAARQVLRELHKVLRDDGFIATTFPLDDRPKGKQHAEKHLIVTVPGETGHDITVWHQTVWSDEMLVTLFAETSFKEVSRTPLRYGFGSDGGGWGLVLEKR